MEQQKKLLEQLQLIAIDYRRLSDDLLRITKYVEEVNQGKHDDSYMSRDELIRHAINERKIRLKDRKRIEKIERKLLRQLEDSIKTEPN